MGHRLGNMVVGLPWRVLLVIQQHQCFHWLSYTPPFYQSKKGLIHLALDTREGHHEVLVRKKAVLN